MMAFAKKSGKIRLDQLLVERGLAASREKAQALVLAGQVTVGGQKMYKPGLSVASDAPIDAYVSRVNDVLRALQGRERFGAKQAVSIGDDADEDGVLSSQFSVLSSQFSVLSSQFSVLSSQFSVLSSQFSGFCLRLEFISSFISA